MKRKTITMATLDKHFREAIYEQYDFTCAFPNCEYCGNRDMRDIRGVECAHWYNRYRASGRWYPDNCAALCHEQHAFLEHNKALETEFFRAHLGEERYHALVKRHQGVFRYLPYQRAEQGDHYRAQRAKMRRQRAAGARGILVLTPWD